MPKLHPFGRDRDAVLVRFASIVPLRWEYEQGFNTWRMSMRPPRDPPPLDPGGHDALIRQEMPPPTRGLWQDNQYRMYNAIAGYRVKGELFIERTRFRFNGVLSSRRYPRASIARVFLLRNAAMNRDSYQEQANECGGAEAARLLTALPAEGQDYPVDAVPMAVRICVLLFRSFDIMGRERVTNIPPDLEQPYSYGDHWEYETLPLDEPMPTDELAAFVIAYFAKAGVSVPDVDAAKLADALIATGSVTPRVATGYEVYPYRFYTVVHRRHNRTYHFVDDHGIGVLGDLAIEETPDVDRR